MPQHTVLDTNTTRRFLFSDFFNPSLPYDLFQAIKNEKKTSPVIEGFTCKLVGFENQAQVSLLTESLVGEHHVCHLVGPLGLRAIEDRRLAACFAHLPRIRIHGDLERGKRDNVNVEC